MKSVLVLYPIQPYADVLMGEKESPEIKVKYAQLYEHLVRNRYPGFRIIWVMFSKPNSCGIADLSQLWSGISIKKSDIVCSCGVSFEDHCGLKRYPNPRIILDACPQPIEELIIGGFHLWDCVEKVARYAHEKAINVLVDEDLTEIFFGRIRGCDGIPSSSRIPLSREESQEAIRKRFIESSPLLFTWAQEARKGKPWLAPI
jgi:hypothetical protein